MKPKLEVLRQHAGSSFLIRRFGKGAFKAPYHFHPEYELTLILDGRGTRYIGNMMSPFEKGDLVLLGANIPHCWKLDPKQNKASCIVIQFSPSFLGEDFFAKPELLNIMKLLKKSASGLHFKSSVHDRILPKLMAMIKAPPTFNRLVDFLEVLNSLSSPNNYKILEQRVSIQKQTESESERINALIGYIVENFRAGISLSQAAKVANMTPPALCRYFKKTTRKTFIEMVCEYRLNYATQQLIQSDKPVSSICYECGFNDISYFNKAFKQKMRLSPLRYRKKFLGEIST